MKGYKFYINLEMHLASNRYDLSWCDGDIK